MCNVGLAPSTVYLYFVIVLFVLFPKTLHPRLGIVTYLSLLVLWKLSISLVPFKDIHLNELLFTTYPFSNLGGLKEVPLLGQLNLPCIYDL